jgi:hypothetical protein
MERLQTEARQVFASSYIAHDFWTFDIPRQK